jgi:hypothetical protein
MMAGKSRSFNPLEAADALLNSVSTGRFVSLVRSFARSLVLTSAIRPQQHSACFINGYNSFNDKISGDIFFAVGIVRKPLPSLAPRIFPFTNATRLESFAGVTRTSPRCFDMCFIIQPRLHGDVKLVMLEGDI